MPNYTSIPFHSAATEDSVFAANVKSLFKCPVCFEYISSPILQCLNGHLICQPCHAKHLCCHSCRSLMTVRNLAMENVAEYFKFPCKHSSYGCNFWLNYSDKAYHEETCIFRPYLCPYSSASCDWQGLSHLVVDHLTWKHNIISRIGDVIEFHVNGVLNPDFNDSVIIQRCFGQDFLIAMMKQNIKGKDQLFGIVQYIGSKRQAENFFYRLELDGTYMVASVAGSPLSIRESFESIIENSNYTLCINDSKIINKFVTADGSMKIKVQIST